MFAQPNCSRNKPWKQKDAKSTSFGFSQLNCRFTTTADGLTAMTLPLSHHHRSLSSRPQFNLFTWAPAILFFSICLLSLFTSLIHEAIFGLRYLSSFQWQTICSCSTDTHIITEPQSPHLSVFSWCKRDNHYHQRVVTFKLLPLQMLFMCQSPAYKLYDWHILWPVAGIWS